MARRRWALLVAVPLLLSACGGGGDGGGDGATVGQSPTATSEQTATDTGTAGGETGGAVTVGVASVGTFGEVLVDGDGMTLYMFDPDMQGESTCYDQCEAAWPPLIGEATAGEGADDSKLGTVARKDGSQQVTYNDWPLYYFAKDQAAGDVTGQGVNSVWWVLNRDGEPIKTAATS